MNRLFLALLVLPLTPSTFAHEGHGVFSPGWAHSVSDHGLVVILVVAMIVAVGRPIRCRDHPRPRR